MVNNDTIEEILTRGVEEVIDRAHFAQILRDAAKRKKKLRIKLGIDPTSPNIHIGRSIPLLKLRDFQEMGHTVVFIVGDFTGLIGDTSDKESERPMLTRAQVKANLKGYIAQAGKILDLKKTETHFNSEWLKKLGYLEIAEQADQFSVHEFTARELIALRLKSGKRVSMREVLYPLMQGYDSVAIHSNLEVGGTDQKFNLLAGRVLQRHYKQEPQDIMTFKLIEGLDGRKMSSSWGNVINLVDSPREMFGKTMTLQDRAIIQYFISCTRVPMKEINVMEREMAAGKLNPRDAKARLASEFVRMYHGAAAAKKAEAEFNKTFRDKETPTDLEEFKLAGRGLLAVLVGAGLAKSNGEGKRLLEQGGVKIDGRVVKDFEMKVPKGCVLQVGKKRFVKIV